MADGKKPAVLVFAGVVEIVFSILIFVYAIISMVMGCGSSAMGMAGAAASGSLSDANATAALGGAGIMILVTVILSLLAIAVGIIGIIGASNLFKGKKAGVGLSNFWAIALFAIFVVGLILSIIQLAGAGAAAGAISEAVRSAGDAGAALNAIDAQAVTSGLPVMMIVLSAIFYLLPALVVFILLKLKPAKDFFAAAA